MITLASDKRKYELIDRFVRDHQALELPLEADFAQTVIRGLARCDHLDEAADFVAYCCARGVYPSPKHMNTLRLRCLHVGRHALWGEIRRMVGSDGEQERR